MDIPSKQEARKQVPRILVVDDDPMVRQITEAALKKSRYKVWTAESAEQALELIGKRGLPHLAVIDIMLPGLDGLGLCRKIHEFSDVPIIMLTVITEEKTVVGAIEKFAEDYVTKPFNPSELVARVGRVLRRMGDFSYTLQPVIRVDDYLSVDFVRLRALTDDRPVSLTPTEAKLLYILMNHAGKTVQTPHLLARLWPKEKADENTLRVHVHRLRQKIEVSPSRPRYVVTERGAGYSFMAAD